MAEKPRVPSQPQAASSHSFAELLDGHLLNGTRPTGNPNTLGLREWSEEDFAEAVGCEVTSDKGCDIRNVQNWRKGRNHPSLKFRNAIAAVLFGENPAWDQDRKRMRSAPKHRAAISDDDRSIRPPRDSGQPPLTSPLSPARTPQNLPFATLGTLFKGRDTFLDALHAELAAGKPSAIIGKALHGLGGVGKTRAAVEYALRFAERYSALLFLRAETPGALETSLAALAGPEILNLPEQASPEDAVKRAASVKWLQTNPGWLLILDNIDSEPARDVALALIDRLKLAHGHVLITARWSNFPPSIARKEIDALAPADAAAFLIERTQTDRQKTPDDATHAADLAEALGGLALGLEQAGAYIATQRITFARYLTLWREKHADVVRWFDKTLMSYNHDTGLAATWATSVDRLTPDGITLMQRLAFLSPDPVPDFLFDVACPSDDGTEFDAHAARADLFAYSLIAKATIEIGKTMTPGITMHRLVQDFVRERSMRDEHRQAALMEALEWVDESFDGDMQDVRNWPVLDPLTPHAIAVADYADAAGIAEPAGHLKSQLGILLAAKARYPESETLMRRALAIAEAHYGPDHHNVALSLNNLADLLKTTNRLAEAEPLARRALAISEKIHDPNDPIIATLLRNLAGLLQLTNRFNEAEPMLRRALAIDETHYGLNHPAVAADLNNLAVLLPATDRLDEAEPLFRRALAIDETHYGLNHPEVATDLDNLAALLRNTNRLDEAEPMIRRALAIDEASFGPDHPRTNLHRANLAFLLLRSDRATEALPLAEKALTAFVAVFGPAHPQTKGTARILASIYGALDRPADASALRTRHGV